MNITNEEVKELLEYKWDMIIKFTLLILGSVLICSLAKNKYEK